MDCNKRAFTMIELLVTIAIIGMLTALLLPAIQSAREACRRAHCVNNMKQQALAIQMHDSQYGVLPPGKLPSQNGNVLNSGFVVILPFLEQNTLFTGYDQTKPPQEEPNLGIVSNSIAVFTCPSMHLGRPVPSYECGEVAAASSYAFCTGSGSSREEHNGAIVGYGPEYLTVSLGSISVADGTSHTLLLGELDYGLENWPDRCLDGLSKGGTTQWAFSYPGHAWGSTWGQFNATQLISGFAEWETFRSDHAGGANLAYSDGSVRWMSESVEPSLLDALATRDGGEVVSQ